MVVILLAGLIPATARADILYVTWDGANNIEKIPSNGVGSVFASVGVNGPQFLAFTDDAGKPHSQSNQAPEPTSAALWGAASASALLLRRRIAAA